MKKPTKTKSNPEPKPYTIGIDLGDKNHAVCIVGTDGEVTDEQVVENTRDALSRSLGGYGKAGALAIIEAGGQSAWIARHLSGIGLEVVVANPRKLRLIAESYTKTDANDAKLLALLGRADRRIFSPVEHRSEEAQRSLAILKGRDALVRSRTSLVNHVRGTMKTFGVKLPSCSTRSFVAACADTLDDRDLTPVANVLANISNLNAEIAEMDRVIKRMCENDYPEAAKLQQIGGVGPISALGFVLTVEDPSRLRNGPRSAGAYFGLVPRKRRSGGSDAQLRITKAGDSFVRRLLVSCAQYIIGPFGPDTAMRRHGLRISERGGKNAKKRAVVAVARKLAVTMASVWESGQDYVDFPGGKPPGPTTGKPTNLGDCGATSA